MNRRIVELCKNLLTSAVTLAVLLGVCELAVRWFGLFAAQRAAVGNVADPGADRDGADGEAVTRYVVHPFLGWSLRPREGLDRFLWSNSFFPDGQPSEWAVNNSYFNVFGYRSSIYDYRTVSADQFVVGIFGGSLAAHLAIVAGDHLKEQLERRYPRLKDRIVVLNLANGSLKQPQQVNTLVEMAMLGVPFDLILNIDGFNEVVFGAADAHFHGLHPIFPSSRQVLSALSFGTGALSPGQIEKTAAILQAREEARRLAAMGAAHPLLRHSRLARAFLGSLVVRHQRQAERLENELQEISGQDRRIPVAEIPDPCLGKSDACWPLIAELWGRGSTLMDALARGLGARYAHFLQPNQYVPGSKVLSPREREVVYPETSGFSRDVPKGYPYLQSRGERLRAANIDFHDLSGIFQDVSETVYIDNCCHLNVVGQRLLAAEIVNRLAADLGSSGPAPPHHSR